MLEPLLPVLDPWRVVLASASPRRREILTHTGLRFEVIPSEAEENLDPLAYAQRPGEFARDTAALKARAVMARLQAQSRPATPLLVIGSDTMVTLDGRLLGQPRQPERARQMLAELSGRDHAVFSGVVLILLQGETRHEEAFYEETRVTFDHLSPEVIEAYVATGEPLDKAGGYGIQARGGTLVRGIQGDFFNVMGFPLHAFCRRLTKLVQDQTSQ